MIIGFEGVSCTGKTSLAAAVAARLGGVPVVPCYYHAAPDPSLLSHPKPRTEQDHLDVLAVHLDVEALRCEQADAAAARGDVILDRTADTPLAHLRAIGRMRGLNADQAGRTMVEEQRRRGRVAVPDVTFYLHADHAVLAARAATRTNMPTLYYDRDFTRHFAAHFTDAPVTPLCIRVSAAAPIPQVADTVMRHLAQVRPTTTAAVRGRR
ncbi:hypothetical protein AB0B45_15360 [Nonomuraea sp. NPDC049152]|uniref:hypothetical protein n=1 Tax=Nonomuraea sp. NPDC049152 TaxID=3154350 RepID=UPI0033D10DB6